MIPEAFISQLLERADIVDVIGRYVPLKKSGRNMQACCPFHKEKTPSFSVSPDRQIYKCFGCGAGGNALNFLMRYEGLSYVEAVEKLADLYHMEVPRVGNSKQDRAKRKAQQGLADYMREASRYYSDALRTADHVINYLKQREISGQTAAKFGLGYAPSGWHALQALFGTNYTAPELLRCGLVLEKNGRRYDAYRDRLIFPIRNTKGLVIGFGARTLKGDRQPKYINSPETPIYHKGRRLYGYYEGRDAIYRKGRAIVVEGYMDVIQLSQAGFEETVAALGTSITVDHINKLFKTTQEIYFSFDGDAAGRKAAVRALEESLSVVTDEHHVHFILLPGDHDPDSLIKEEGKRAFEREIQRSLGLVEFAKQLLLEGKDLAYAEDRARLVAQGKAWVTKMVKAPTLRLALMQEIATHSRFSLEEVQRQYGFAVTSPAPAARPNMPSARRPWGGAYGRFSGARNEYRSWDRSRWYRPPAEARIGVTDLRERILQCLLAYPELIDEFDGSITDEFFNSTHQVAEQIIEVWRARCASVSQGVHTATLLYFLKDSPYLAKYEELLSTEMQWETSLECARIEVRQNFLKLRLERLNLRMQSFQCTTARDREKWMHLFTRRARVQKQIQEVTAQEQTCRMEMDRERALDTQRKRDQLEGKKSMKLDANPKVRALQRRLFGLTDASEKASDARIEHEQKHTMTAQQADIRAALDGVHEKAKMPALSVTPRPLVSDFTSGMESRPFENYSHDVIRRAPPAYLHERVPMADDDVEYVFDDRPVSNEPW